MKKQFTKMMSVVLSLLMLCTVFPLTVMAETATSGTCGANLTWTLDSDGTLTISGTGAMNDVTVGWEGSEATSNAPWYNHRGNIKKIVIGHGVTSIGEQAFRSCTALKEIEFNSGVKTISYCAFYNCTALESIYIPDNVTRIENRAFGDCTKIKSIHIGDGDVIISRDAFSYCNSLEKLYIEGASEIDLGFDSYHLSPLESITILSDDCEIIDCPSLPEDIIFFCHSGSTTALYAKDYSRPFIPVDKTDDYILASGAIGNAMSTLTKNGILTINGTGDMASVNSQLRPWDNYYNVITEIVVGHGIESIASFDDCDKVTSIHIPVTVTEISYDTFKNCDAISDVYYAGTEEEWALIKFNSSDDKNILNNATMHFEHCYANADEKHNYTTEVVTPPTCTEQGYTTYVCTCGQSYISDYTNTIDHIYEAVITQEPTHSASGIKTFTCKCGDSYTEFIPKLKHEYTISVIAPTCTDYGYTLHTCDCGYSYRSDFVNNIDHVFSPEITTPATHFTDGVRTFTCECGKSYTETIYRIPHNYYVSETIYPTCSIEGYTVYTCECGDTYNDDYVDYDYSAHVNEDGDGLCDYCGELATYCSCNCHSTNSFIAFFWKILNFLQRLFGTNPVCKCGMAHY